LEANDLAIIQVEPPFDNVTPFTYLDTPISGELLLMTVGYRGDVPKDMEGQFMYKSEGHTNLDLRKQAGC
jgi:hypothetical protein